MLISSLSLILPRAQKIRIRLIMIEKLQLLKETIMLFVKLSI